MARTILVIGLLMAVTCIAKAQQYHYATTTANPFKDVFLNTSYKDTVTISALYTGETGTISENNLTTLKQINKLYGISIGRFKNGIGLTFNGYSRKFYVPYSRENSAMVGTIKPNTLIRLKCTVYRFFTIDGVANFFYIDKVL